MDVIYDNYYWCCCCWLLLLMMIIITTTTITTTTTTTTTTVITKTTTKYYNKSVSVYLQNARLNVHLTLNVDSNISMQGFKECMSDSVINYNFVGNTQISISIKKTNANKCTLGELFLTEI